MDDSILEKIPDDVLANIGHWDFIPPKLLNSEVIKHFNISLKDCELRKIKQGYKQWKINV